MEPLFSLIITYAIFGSIGFYLARKFKPHPSVSTWIVLGLLAILSQFSFASIRIVDILSSIIITLNYALQGIFVGILAGLFKREMRVKM